MALTNQVTEKCSQCREFSGDRGSLVPLVQLSKMTPQQKTVYPGQGDLARATMPFEEILKFAQVTQVCNPGMWRKVALVSKVFAELFNPFLHISSPCSACRPI
jgi:hypothetical protein